jgi:hypothetical protein
MMRAKVRKDKGEKWMSGGSYGNDDSEEGDSHADSTPASGSVIEYQIKGGRRHRTRRGSKRRESKKRRGSKRRR